MKIENKKLNILFLCQISLNNAQTIVDHVFAFQEYSCHNIFIIPWMGGLPRQLNFNCFDVLVIHYTVIPFLTSFLTKTDRAKITSFKGLKVGFRQDEYQHIFKYHEEMRLLGYDLFYTCIPEHNIKTVYPEFLLPNITIKNTLTGFVPKSFLNYPRPPISERSVHIGYRARSCAFWFGDLTYEKIKIAEDFSEICKRNGLNSNTSAKEEERLYGKDWAEFIGQCKCVLGTESGASVLDFNGELEQQWFKLTQSPWSSENISTFTYFEYRDSYLKGRQRIGLMNQISPRVFEAAAMGTALVLYEGGYSTILEPNRHYIPVKKDYSNRDEVLRKIKDDKYLQEMAEVTYQEIACNPAYSYQTFVNQFDHDIACYSDKTATKSYTRQSFSKLLNKQGYLDIYQFIKQEQQGIEGYVRPFDISKLPCTLGKKLS